MILFFYGSREFVKDESRKVRDALLSKKADATFLSYSEETAGEYNLTETTEGAGLFSKTLLVELDGLFGAGEFSGGEKKAITAMGESENIFLILEEKLPKKILDALKKSAEKAREEKRAPAPKKDFSAFSLADALGSRDKKKLWILFRESVLREYALEEVHGILFWQAKMIVLAHKTESAGEAGVKDFPYKKAKGAASRYSLEESEHLLRALTDALLRARTKNIPLEHTLERAILSL